MADLAKTASLAAAACICALVLGCSELGSSGDDCVTPADCEVGLQCYLGTCTSASLTCAEGTEEVNGRCVTERTRCGRNTIEVDGECVPEPEEPVDAGVDAGEDASVEPGDAGADGGDGGA